MAAPTPFTGSARSTRSRDRRSAKLPVTLKVLLENLLRNEDDAFVKRADIETLAKWDVKAGVEREIAFRTSRVLLQDFTGVPAVVDLAAMRDAIASLGGDPALINPLQPVDLVIDHSVQVDEYGSDAAFLDQRGARVRSQSRALRISALGPERVPRISASCRRTRGSCTRSISNISARWCSRARRMARRVAYPGLARGHRLAHDDDQRARRASAGALAGSRPRRRCSGSRCRC